jgi:hypothetical protein
VAALVAIGVFIACLIAGAILMGLGHWVIGFAVLPLLLVTRGRSSRPLE